MINGKIEETEAERRRNDATRRFVVLRPYLEGDLPLAACAAEMAVSLRTARRWLSACRRDGIKGLTRAERSDKGRRVFPKDLVTCIEGMALKKPRTTIATIHRRVSKIAMAEGWPVPSYSTVYAAIRRLNPSMITLAQEGDAAWRDKYEIICHHRAEAPNQIWQADHTLLYIMIVDADGREVRPWLTQVLDDHSRAIAGYSVFLGAPSATNTALALRQAIWRTDCNGSLRRVA